MLETFFEIQLPFDGVPADMAELEAVVKLQRTVQNMPQFRDDEFDARYRSDSALFEIISWVAAGGAAGVAIPLKSVLTAYFKTRSKEVNITIGKNSVKLKGPLSKKQIDDTVDKFIELNGK